jgi:hypothetical protein
MGVMSRSLEAGDTPRGWAGEPWPLLAGLGLWAKGALRELPALWVLLAEAQWGVGVDDGVGPLEGGVSLFRFLCRLRRRCLSSPSA